MKLSAARAFLCPRCGARLAEVSGSALLDCAACASPLAVHLPDQALRESIAPGLTGEEATKAADAVWRRKEVPEGFGAAIGAGPQLLFAAVAETMRTISGSGSVAVSEGYEAVLAAPAPGIPIEKADVKAMLAAGKRVAFVAADLQKRGLVLDPLRSPAQLFPKPKGELLEERLGVVYAPFWLLRRSYGNGRYEALVDAVTGTLVHARAPVARRRKLVEAFVLAYLLAAILVMPVSGWQRVASALLTLEEPGVALLLLIPAALLTLAAWSWDRVRFRYEIAGNAQSCKITPVNRPDKTLLERIRNRVAEVTIWVLSKIL